MKNWIAIWGIGAGLFFTMVCAAAESNWGTVIAKIVGPSEPTPGTTLVGYSNIFWTTIEIKETRRFFAPELVGTNLKILTTSFSSNLVDQTIPLEIIRTPADSTNDFERLERYRFQCGEFYSGYFAGKFDEETPHGVVLAKIKGLVGVPGDLAARYVNGDRLPPLLEFEVLDVLQGFAPEFKGNTLSVLAGTIDADLIGKTIALEVYKSPSTNYGTPYFFKNGFDYSRRVGALVQQRRDKHSDR